MTRDDWDAFVTDAVDKVGQPYEQAMTALDRLHRSLTAPSRTVRLWRCVCRTRPAAAPPAPATETTEPTLADLLEPLLRTSPTASGGPR